MAWARDTAVSVVTAVIRGVDVKGSWRPSSTPGMYWLSYVVPAGDPLLIAKPPAVQLQLVDSRYVCKATVRCGDEGLFSVFYHEVVV